MPYTKGGHDMMEELALISSILAIPVLSGALKDAFENDTIRTLTKILSPTVGISPLC